MNVRNCKSCGKIFNYIAGPPVCPACREKLEVKFQEVKRYIQGHANSTIADVAKACDVEDGQIRQWVREERLTFAEGSAIGIECESCGTLIWSGRYCAKCKAEMVNGLSGYTKKAEQPKPPIKDTKDSPKMRFI